MRKKVKNYDDFLKSRTRQWDAMIFLPLLHVFLFRYLPMFGLIIVFKDYRYAKGIFGSKWVGLKNFEIFWKSNDIWGVVGNTVWLNVLGIVFGMAASLILAVLLYELKSKKALKAYQTAYLTPNFVSWIVGGYVVYALLSPETGVINAFLKGIGLEAVSWYTEPQYWPAILTIAGIWKGVGMGCILYYAGLMGIDSSLFEAAELDGANKVQKVRYIMIPEITAIICMKLIMDIGHILGGDFDKFYTLTRNVSELRKGTDILATYTFRLFKENNNPSLSSSISFVQSVIGLILTITVNKIIKKVDSDSSLF